MHLCWNKYFTESSMHDTCDSCLTSGMTEVLYSRASIPFTRDDGGLLLELCLRDIAPAAAAVVAAVVVVAAVNREGRTHGVDWNDGSLCSMSRMFDWSNGRSLQVRERITSATRVRKK